LIQTHKESIKEIRKEFGHRLYRNRSHFLKRFLKREVDQSVIPEITEVAFVGNDNDGEKFRAFVRTEDLSSFVLEMEK
jgi:thermostable 8-oxoguanine DNA glycosylase